MNGIIGSKTVHQCLFCPQTFDSAIQKDDHILEHFAQETCTDCDQSLIQIGSNLYTIHNTVTCIKRETKPEATILNASRNETITQGDCNAASVSTHESSDKQMRIKEEPEGRDEAHLKFIQTDYIDSCERFIHQNYDGDDSVIDAVASNTISDEQMEIKIESEALLEQIICEDLNNSTESNYSDQDSGQVFQSQSPSTVSPKAMNSHVPRCKQSTKAVRRSKKDRPPNANEEDIGEENRPKHERVPCDVCGEMLSSFWMTRHKILRHGLVTCHRERIKRSKEPGCRSIKSISRDANEQVMATKQDPREEAEPRHIRFPCHICGEVVSSLWMSRHKKSKHGLSVFEDEIEFDQYQCDICQRFIQKKTTLIAHMKLKHGSNRTEFNCQHCSRKFSSKQSLEIHQIKNICKSKNNPSNEDQNHVCDLCDDSTFPTKLLLHRHKFHMHKSGGHLCKHCKRVFYSAAGIMSHEAKCEILSNRSFECFLCHKPFSAKSSVQLHLKTIHNAMDKKFKCEICQKSFLFRSILSKHMNEIHYNPDSKNFVCAWCGKAFKKIQDCSRHEQIHGVGRPYHCKFEGCQKTFKTVASRSDHMRFHRGQKKHRCRIDGCTEQFNGVIAYKKHKMIVHGVPMT